MSFRFLLYLVVLMPFVVLGAVDSLGLRHAVGQFEAAMERDRAIWLDATSRTIAERLDAMDKATISLSRPGEIANAVLNVDNNVLFDWGASFVGSVDSVIFADTSGLVLARAPDEYRFGDTFAAEPWFRTSVVQGRHRGIATIDGAESLFFCRSIRKYDDVGIGVVCVVVRLTQALLDRMVPIKTLAVTILRPDGGVIGKRPNAAELHRARLGLSMDGYDFELTFVEDERVAEIAALERSILVNGILAASVALAALLFFVRHQFAPYTSLVNGIVDYSAKRIDLETLRERLLALRRRPRSEIARVATALVDMIDVLKANMVRIEDFNTYLRDLASKDPLTLLRNRRSLDEALAVETQRSRRYRSPLCVLLIDLDHFKMVNDTHGHAGGDEALRRVAEVITANSRATDIVGRWGGEEFMILCPGVALSSARTYAEKLRQQIERAEIGLDVRITASVGVAEHITNEPAREMIERADRALYEAKAAGRNKVCTHVA